MRRPKTTAKMIRTTYIEFSKHNPRKGGGAYAVRNTQGRGQAVGNTCNVKNYIA